MGFTKTGFSVETPVSNDVTYSGLFDLAAVGASSSTNIQIVIDGVTNPNRVMTTESFKITTLDDARNEIDKISTGLVVKITQPGTISINSFIVGDYTVDTPTYIQLDMVPSARYSSGGYIEVVCP